jgi:hypothetical protein
VRFPSYETSFRTFALRVLLDRPFGRDAAADATQLVAALKAGRAYSAIDAVASPAALQFSAIAEGRTVAQGGIVNTAGPVSVAAHVPGTGGTIMLRRDG